MAARVTRADGPARPAAQSPHRPDCHNSALTELVLQIAAELPELGIRRVIAAVDDARKLSTWASHGAPSMQDVQQVARTLLSGSTLGVGPSAARRARRFGIAHPE